MLGTASAFPYVIMAWFLIKHRENFASASAFAFASASLLPVEYRTVEHLKWT
jgi:hypothetical protein